MATAKKWFSHFGDRHGWEKTGKSQWRVIASCHYDMYSFLSVIFSSFLSFFFHFSILPFSLSFFLSFYLSFFFIFVFLLCFLIFLIVALSSLHGLSSPHHHFCYQHLSGLSAHVAFLSHNLKMVHQISHYPMSLEASE